MGVLAAAMRCEAAPSSVASGTLSAWQMLEELNKFVPQKGAQILVDDDVYGIARHEWVVKQLERYVEKTWHQRAYVPHVNDCDDFADDLRYQLRRAWRDSARPDNGGAPVAMSNYLWVDPEKGVYAHAVVLIRTDRGWYVADPTKGWNALTQRLDLLPFGNLQGLTSRVIF